MTLTRNLLCCSVALGAFFFAAPAFADSLPPAAEDCKGSGGTVELGGACSLHDTANTPGTCQNSTCSHATNPAFCDGSCTATDEPCVLCVSGTATDGGSTTTDGGTTGTTSTGKSSGGCSVSGSGVSPLSIILPLGLASLVPLALRRKKKSSDKKA